MGRRGGTLHYTCAETDCRESGCVDWDNQRERAELAASRKNWRCLRHRDPERVIGAANSARRHVLIAMSHPSAPGLYWADEGAEKGSMGVVSGPGFRAYANDFSSGTRLVVTAHIEAAAPSVPSGEETP